MLRIQITRKNVDEVREGWVLTPNPQMTISLEAQKIEQVISILREYRFALSPQGFDRFALSTQTLGICRDQVDNLISIFKEIHEEVLRESFWLQNPGSSLNPPNSWIRPMSVELQLQELDWIITVLQGYVLGSSPDSIHVPCSGVDSILMKLEMFGLHEPQAEGGDHLASFGPPTATSPAVEGTTINLNDRLIAELKEAFKRIRRGIENED